MRKQRYTVTSEEAEDGTWGICLACGELQHGYEPDARACECLACCKRMVYGVEEAILMDAVDVDE